MAKKTTPNTDPVNGIKETVEHIIGVPLSLKPKKKNKADVERDQFEALVKGLEYINTRTTIMFTDMGMDTTNYDELFYNLINNLIIDKYGNECAELIFFYVYERVNDDSTINELIDNNGNSVVLSTIQELWEIIKVMKLKQ